MRKNNNQSTATAYPYFVDVQSELLDSLNTRLVVPLTPIELLEKKAPSHLCPIIHIDEGDFVESLLIKWLVYQLEFLRPQSTR